MRYLDNRHTLFQAGMKASLTYYLPTYLTAQGQTLHFSDLALTVIQLAGAGGALMAGTLSDRFGRMSTLLVVSIFTPLLTLLFLQLDSYWIFPVLLPLGFFLFAPIFAFFFWLIYSKKKYTYMEHMVLIFHIFSFIFLASLIALIPDTIIGDDYASGILFGLIGPFYFYKALRNFYKQNRLITIIKFIFLNWVVWISATVSAVAFFAVTAAMYS